MPPRKRRLREADGQSSPLPDQKRSRGPGQISDFSIRKETYNYTHNRGDATTSSSSSVVPNWAIQEARKAFPAATDEDLKKIAGECLQEARGRQEEYNKSTKQIRETNQTGEAPNHGEQREQSIPGNATTHRSDTNPRSKRQFSDEGQRGEAASTEFVSSNASWNDTSPAGTSRRETYRRTVTTNERIATAFRNLQDLQQTNPNTDPKTISSIFGQFSTEEIVQFISKQEQGASTSFSSFEGTTSSNNKDEDKGKGRATETEQKTLDKTPSPMEQFLDPNSKWTLSTELTRDHFALLRTKRNEAKGDEREALSQLFKNLSTIRKYGYDPDCTYTDATTAYKAIEVAYIEDIYGKYEMDAKEICKKAGFPFAQD